MNTLIIATTSWPEAFTLVGVVACFVFLLCVMVTEKWPWQK
jgi:hypothetical protein